MKHIKEKEFKEKIENFNFRFIEHSVKGLYEIRNAKKWQKDTNAEICRIMNDSVSFWTDDCCDHTYVLYFKDILLG